MEEKKSKEKDGNSKKAKKSASLGVSSKTTTNNRLTNILGVKQ